MTSEEIERDWKIGKQDNELPRNELGEIRKLPKLKASNSGIFAIGEKIEIVKDGKIIETFSYDKSGVYEKVFEGDVAKIDKILRLSVVKRIEGLSEVGVIFSGGLDSSYLALLLKVQLFFLQMLNA